jgi:hypothetical protein
MSANHSLAVKRLAETGKYAPEKLRAHRNRKPRPRSPHPRTKLNPLGVGVWHKAHRVPVESDNLGCDNAVRCFKFANLTDTRLRTAALDKKAFYRGNTPDILNRLNTINRIKIFIKKAASGPI